MDKAMRESTRTQAEREAQKRYRQSENGKLAIKRAQTKCRHKRMLERLVFYEYIELNGGVKMTQHQKHKLAKLKEEFKDEATYDSLLNKYLQGDN